jgi:L-ribulokinase
MREVYRPAPEAVAVYARLYREYLRLHDLFGRDPDSVMKRLNDVRREQRELRPEAARD